MNFSTYLVQSKIFRWAGHVIFGAWHQNRGGILQVCTKSDYTELTNLIWPLLPNFTQSIPQSMLIINSYRSTFKELKSKTFLRNATKKFRFDYLANKYKFGHTFTTTRDHGVNFSICRECERSPELHSSV